MNIQSKILTVKCPEHWGTQDPNETARNNAILLTIWASKHTSVQPTILASIEGGIYVSYCQGQKEFVFESYNNGTSACIVTDDDKVIYNKDITYKKDFNEACSVFTRKD